MSPTSCQTAPPRNKTFKNLKDYKINKLLTFQALKSFFPKFLQTPGKGANYRCPSLFGQGTSAKGLTVYDPGVRRQTLLDKVGSDLRDTLAHLG
jgi:hypothetical protein